MMSLKPMLLVKITFQMACQKRIYYTPVGRGLEIKIAEKLQHLEQLDKKYKNNYRAVVRVWYS